MNDSFYVVALWDEEGNKVIRNFESATTWTEMALTFMHMMQGIGWFIDNTDIEAVECLLADLSDKRMAKYAKKAKDGE